MYSCYLHGIMHFMDSRAFQAVLDQDKDGTWWYVHVPKDIRADWKYLEKRGIIHVTATIGETSWQGSMLPWADGSAQITINSMIRAREHLVLGQKMTIQITPLARL
jgi:hypothetical protein